MQHTTLTHPQLLRAWALARRYNHGWATELDLLGLDPEHRCGEYLRPSDDAHPGEEWAWQRTRRLKLARATEAELAALSRVEAAIGGGEVSVADIETVALTGSEDWSETHLHGIWAPCLDADGDVRHTTGSGRLSWLVYRDGRAELFIARPDPDGNSLWVLRAEAGPVVVTREYADGNPATQPGHGYVRRRSALTVTRERKGGALYLRHVLALREALSALDVEWDPALEVV